MQNDLFFMFPLTLERSPESIAERSMPQKRRYLAFVTLLWTLLFLSVHLSHGWTHTSSHNGGTVSETCVVCLLDHTPTALHGDFTPTLSEVITYSHTPLLIAVEASQPLALPLRNLLIPRAPPIS